jgi:hypothetical protein
VELVTSGNADTIFFFSRVWLQRWMHDRNKKAMELIAKGWSALQEVDRVIDYADHNDKRLIPLLRVLRVYLPCCPHFSTIR